MCDPYDMFSHPMDPAITLLVRRWGPELLLELDRGATRYGELFRALPGISQRTLSAKIAQLRATGIIARVRDTTGRPRYSLTLKGRSLVRLYDPLATFSVRWHGLP
jgi:DNA-binding HxlR family transcriptional regulator